MKTKIYFTFMAIAFAISSFGQNVKQTEVALLKNGNLSSNYEGMDTSGKIIQLHSVKSKYTLVYFHDPDCHQCKVFVPYLNSKYDSLKTCGIEFYGVLVKYTSSVNGINLLKECYYDCALRGYNVFPAMEFYSQLKDFEVFSTPLFFILDSQKNFLTERLGSDDLFKALKLLKKTM